MSLSSAVGLRLFQAGLRKPVAALASAVYSRTGHSARQFWIDEQGHWVNQQPEATIVSPIPHTTTYASYRAWVLDNWAHRYRPREGDTVLDVGAGVGEEAVVFSRLVGAHGRVISIEAHPQTYACLVQTIARSGLSNVVPVCAAVSDCDGTARIGSVDNHLANSIVATDAGVEVPARSLDSIAADYSVGSVALIKMNIEGAERLAVSGMEKLAGRTSNICISCHDFVADRDGDARFRTKAEVKQHLERYGFELSTRPDDERPWVRDYLYGSRRA